MTEKRFRVSDIIVLTKPNTICDGDIFLNQKEACNLLNKQHEENQLLKEEKKLLKNKLDRIEDILPHFLSCAEISEFRGKTVKEDLALMKCWNKRYQND